MLPGLLGLLGASGAGLALTPALRALNLPFLILTVVLLGRGWYLQISHGIRGGSSWSRGSLLVLSGSTALAALLWGLRFGGLLGMPPF